MSARGWFVGIDLAPHAYAQAVQAGSDADRHYIFRIRGYMSRAEAEALRQALNSALIEHDREPDAIVREQREDQEAAYQAEALDRREA